NANTLIINRADQFGLADLYQLRGRVGRFTRKACAYLVVPRGTILSQKARQRLQAIMQHTALGSGFHIAMEDLKLRGAGNLLGVEQHGHITAVGFDLYCRLLREAVAHLQRQPELAGTR
ncbi:MAG TPA: transcription-repair coupling factor, partial [Candidatus Omnitrophica bacterium]|nr:transcription-repair coupling factor [Candidatus Omnitrophota bacterium]